MMKKTQSLPRLYQTEGRLVLRKTQVEVLDKAKKFDEKYAAELEETWPPPLKSSFSHSIAVGNSHTAVIKNGQVFCWGSNQYGQLGVEVENDEKVLRKSLAPAKLPAEAISIAAGKHSTMALLADGQVFSWGSNQYGQLGLGKSEDLQRTPQGPVPLRIPYPENFDPLTPDPEQTSLLLPYPPQDFPKDIYPIPPSLNRIPTPPKLLPNHKHPNAPPQQQPQTQPQTPPPELIVRATGIVEGEAHSCILREDGKLFCWGENDFGRLGMNHTNHTRCPTLPVCLPDRVVQAAAGQAHTAAILADGRLFCWGFNGDGQLGLGHKKDTLCPTEAVKLPAPALMISCGFSHTVALLDTGKVFCWGWNYHGRLGLGNEESHYQPTTPVKLPSNAIAVSAGWDFTCALLDDGRIFSWGNNTDGQLGLNTYRPQGFSRDKYSYYCTSPLNSVNLPEPAVALATGTHHAVALLANDQVFCWGCNQKGQLGINDNKSTIGPSIAVSFPCD